MKARTERHEATATCPGGATVIETTLLLAKVAAGTTDPPRLRTMVPADMLPIGIRRPSAGKAAPKVHTPADAMIAEENAAGVQMIVDRADQGTGARQSRIGLPLRIASTLQRFRRTSPRRTLSPRFAAIYAR